MTLYFPPPKCRTSTVVLISFTEMVHQVSSFSRFSLLTESQSLCDVGRYIHFPSFMSSNVICVDSDCSRYVANDVKDLP